MADGSTGRLTTHVLDTMHGVPGRDIEIELFRLTRGERTLLRTIRTNADGRPDPPLLAGPELEAGSYELLFHIGQYFRDRGVALPEPPFLDQVPVRFAVADSAGHYHVPLLISPWAYSTYRGS
jgi:5-hydroxyisourate hydrolase